MSTRFHRRQVLAGSGAAALTLGFGLDAVFWAIAAALATVVGVLIEVPVMLSVVWIVNRSKPWYEGAAVDPTEFNRG